jgi:hypothetical protein
LILGITGIPSSVRSASSALQGELGAS